MVCFSATYGQTVIRTGDNCTYARMVSTEASEGVEASEIRCVVKLNDIPDMRYCLSRPLWVEIEKDLSGFIVSDPDTGVFGYADDLGAALNRFFTSFVSQYEFLRANRGQLSSSMRSELERLENTLKPSC